MPAITYKNKNHPPKLAPTKSALKPSFAPQYSAPIVAVGYDPTPNINPRPGLQLDPQILETWKYRLQGLYSIVQRRKQKEIIHKLIWHQSMIIKKEIPASVPGFLCLCFLESHQFYFNSCIKYKCIKVAFRWSSNIGLDMLWWFFFK